MEQGVCQGGILSTDLYKVSKGAKTRNRYNQVPHLDNECLFVCSIYVPVTIFIILWYLIVSIPDLSGLIYFVLAPADKAANNVVVI